MERWRKKINDPAGATVEAVQLTRGNVREVADWVTGKEVEEIDSLNPDVKYVGLNLVTWEGLRRASEGDYIIKDNLGEFHVRWPENFESDFEKVE